MKYSRASRSDLRNIRDYTRSVWGLAQVERYLSDLEDTVILLAGHPEIGRACLNIRPGLHRFERGKHVIFYRIRAEHIFISRILHHQMVPDGYRFY